jgi:tRNA(fMet)-specific endonuclease VapC
MAEKMILVDTNILIEIYKNNSTIIDAVIEIGQDNVLVSDVTCAELYYGARNKRELQLISKDIKKLNLVSVDVEISKLAVDLVEKFALSHKLSVPDALIAATAMVYKVKLFSLNIKDFIYIKGLELYKY